MNTVKPVMRGHLSGCVLIAFPVKHFVGYFNIEIYLRRRDTCHEGTPVMKGHCSSVPCHRFYCSDIYQWCLTGLAKAWWCA